MNLIPFDCYRKTFKQIPINLNTPFLFNHLQKFQYKKSMSLTIQQIRKMNAAFGCSLIDQKFLQQFQSEFHYDFLYQIHYIRGIKNQNQKKDFCEVLQQQANQLLKYLGKKKVSFGALQSSKKVSDTVSVIRDILCKNSKAMRQFMDQRKQILNSLKAKGDKKKADQETIIAFHNFYQLFLQGNLIGSKKSTKTVLTGIRKLFKQQAAKKKDKRQRRKQKDLLKHRRMLYQTNRIIRDILDHCQSLNRKYENDPQFSQSISQLLKDRRWMGPNLFKILLKHKWKGYEIDTLIDLMQVALKSQQKFSDPKTQNMVRRTIANMRICSTFVKDHPNATNSFRFIATVSNWGSNHIFSVQDLENQMMMAVDLDIRPGRQLREDRHNLSNGIMQCINSKQFKQIERLRFSSEISMDFNE